MPPPDALEGHSHIHPGVASAYQDGLRSLTFVPVGPGTNRSPCAPKGRPGVMAREVRRGSAPAAASGRRLRPSQRRRHCPPDPSMRRWSGGKRIDTAMRRCRARSDRRNRCCVPLPVTFAGDLYCRLAAESSTTGLRNRTVARRPLPARGAACIRPMSRASPLDRIRQDHRLDAAFPRPCRRRFQRNGRRGDDGTSLPRMQDRRAGVPPRFGSEMRRTRSGRAIGVSRDDLARFFETGRSATVGPEATKGRIVAGARRRRRGSRLAPGGASASRPPLIREACLRTHSWRKIGAPGQAAPC